MTIRIDQAETIKAIARRRLSIGIGRRRFGKPPKWLYPMAVEMRYRSALLNVVSIIEQETKRLFPDLGSFVQEVAAQKKDAWGEEINSGIKALNIAVGQKLTVQNSQQVSAEVANNIGNWNDAQWRKTMRGVMGVELFTAEPYLRDMYSNFVEQNTGLIKSLESETVKRVETTIRNGVSSGDRVEKITKDLKNQFSISKNRARLIARDQVGKLNGDLQAARQQSVGVSMYIWRTSEDERVRENHKAMNGRLCKWDDATVYWNEATKSWAPRSGIGGVELHPGRDYQCRCYAEPYFAEIEQEAIKTAEQPPTIAKEVSKRPSRTKPAPAPELKQARKSAQSQSISAIEQSIKGAVVSSLYKDSSGVPYRLVYRKTAKDLGTIKGFSRTMPPDYLDLYDSKIKEIERRGNKINVPGFRGIKGNAGGAYMNIGDGVLGISHERVLSIYDHETFGYGSVIKRLEAGKAKFIKTHPETMPTYYASSFKGGQEEYSKWRTGRISTFDENIKSKKDLRIAESKTAKDTGGFPFVSKWKIGDPEKDAPYNAFYHFADKKERVAAILDHEYGHVIAQYANANNTGRMYGLKDEIRDAFDTAKKSRNKFASKYPLDKNKSEEFFAENYSLWVGNKKDLVHPDIIPLFKKWGL